MMRWLERIEAEALGILGAPEPEPCQICRETLTTANVCVRCRARNLLYQLRNPGPPPMPALSQQARERLAQPGQPGK